MKIVMHSIPALFLRCSIVTNAKCVTDKGKRVGLSRGFNFVKHVLGIENEQHNGGKIVPKVWM